VNPRSLIVFLAALLSPYASQLGATDHAYAIELAQYKSKVKATVDAFRRNYLPQMSAEAKAVDADVQYTIKETFGINAFARQHQIIMTSGTAVFFQWMAEAIVLGQKPRYQKCMSTYINALVATTLANTGAVEDHEPLHEIGSPITFFETEAAHDLACPKPSNGIVFSEREQAFIGITVGSSIDLLLLHEIGHEVLHHVDSRPSSKAESRAREQAADSWAAAAAGDAGLDVTKAVPAFILFAVADPGKIELEPLLDHPLGGNRCIAIYDKVIEHLRNNSAFNNQLRADGEYDAYWKTASAARQQLLALAPQ